MPIDAPVATEPRSLQGLLSRLIAAGRGKDQVTLGELLDAVGRRSFGPLVLMCGVIVFSPLGGIVGLPTAIALLVILIAVQHLLHRKQFWLPEWLLRRRVGRALLVKALRFMLPPARLADRHVHPRLKFLTGRTSMQIVAVICVLLALTMPPLEVVPFANSATGLALAIFGLALIARDGLLVLLGLSMVSGVTTAILLLI